MCIQSMVRVGPSGPPDIHGHIRTLKGIHMKAFESGKRTIRSFPLALGLAIACPWAAGAATIVCKAATVPALNTCFTKADADPDNSYEVILTTTSKAYMLTQTLKLTQGTVYLRSSANDLNNAQSYILDGGYPNNGWKRVFMLSQNANGRRPYLSISGVTVRNGVADGDYGGGIYVGEGSVSIMNSYVEKNRSSRLGSGVYIQGTGEAYVYNSIIRDNINFYSASTNTTSPCGGLMASGGGLAVWGGFLNVHKSTISGNNSCRGGGIAAYPGSYLTVENSTISGNTTDLMGGGILIYGNVNTYLAFNTIMQNKAGVKSNGGTGFWDEKYGGGIALTAWEAPLHMRGNVIAKNEVVFSNKKTLAYHGHDCYDRWTTTGFRVYDVESNNFVGARANCSWFGAEDWMDIGSETTPKDPKLGSLSVKTGTQGPQYTHAPLSGSPVIGGFWSPVNGYGCPYDDQLGHRRDWYENGSFNPRTCDQGAHQYNWYH